MASPSIEEMGGKANAQILAARFPGNNRPGRERRPPARAGTITIGPEQANKFPGK
jgi:hypothetical protein